MADNGNVEVKLNNVRLSFPHLFKAQKGKNPDDKAKFNAAFLLDKETKQGRKNIALMEEAIEEAIEAKWADKPPRLKDDKKCLRDGDDETWDGYEGMMYVTASNTRRPKVIDRDRTPLTEEDGVVYAGCVVNAIIRVWCQDNDHGKRVNASLEGVQFVKDGEAFGSKGIDDDAFEDLGDDEEDDFDSRPAKKSAKKSSKRARDEDDNEDEEERSSRKKPSKRARDEEEEEEEERTSRKAKASKSKRPRDDEEEEEEEEERPRKKGKASTSRRRSRDDDEDPLG